MDYYVQIPEHVQQKKQITETSYYITIGLFLLLFLIIIGILLYILYKYKKNNIWQNPIEYQITEQEDTYQKLFSDLENLIQPTNQIETILMDLTKQTKSDLNNIETIILTNRIFEHLSSQKNMFLSQTLNIELLRPKRSTTKTIIKINNIYFYIYDNRKFSIKVDNPTTQRKTKIQNKIDHLDFLSSLPYQDRLIFTQNDKYSQLIQLVLDTIQNIPEKGLTVIKL